MLHLWDFDDLLCCILRGPPQAAIPHRENAVAAAAAAAAAETAPSYRSSSSQNHRGKGNNNNDTATGCEGRSGIHAVKECEWSKGSGGHGDDGDVNRPSIVKGILQLISLPR